MPPQMVKSYYADEVIPFVANIRTRVSLYQYENGRLPCAWGGALNEPLVETWIPMEDEGNKAWDGYMLGCARFSSDNPPLNPKKYERPHRRNDKIGHFAPLVDLDLHDLCGHRSRPSNYQYLVMRNDEDNAEYAYFIGCFGDGNRLARGTGYAVCEIVAKGHKYVGNWSRYKSAGDTQICFTASTQGSDWYSGCTLGCYVPEKSAFDNMSETDGHLDVIRKMEAFGWTFDLASHSDQHGVRHLPRSGRATRGNDMESLIEAGILKKLDESPSNYREFDSGSSKKQKRSE